MRKAEVLEAPLLLDSLVSPGSPLPANTSSVKALSLRDACHQDPTIPLG